MTLPPIDYPLSEEPCPRCLPVAFSGRMWLEGLGRLAEDPARRPSAHDGSGDCCDDCRAADSLQRASSLPRWSMARVAVANDRCEQLRLCGLPMGLVIGGYMRPSRKGDFEEQHAWLVRAKLVKQDETPADSEGTWSRLRRLGTPRVVEAVERTGMARCYKCGRECDEAESFCFGCREVTCSDCEMNHTLMGPHEVEDHYRDPEEE